MLWEYEAITVTPADAATPGRTVAMLNEMGAKGWECFITNKYPSGYGCAIEYYFKRRIVPAGTPTTPGDMLVRMLGEIPD